MPISKNGKPYFTTEQYDYARYSTSALEYAKAQGYDLIETSKYAFLKEHDSMVFSKNGQWFWNSKNLRGGALEFMMAYEGRSLVESVLILNGETLQHEISNFFYDTPRSPAHISDFSVKSAPDETKLFELPAKDDSNNRLYAYLVHYRGISKKVIDTMIDNGILYQSAETFNGSNKTINNCVFVTYDQDNIPVSAFKRGAAQSSSFKMEVAGSKKGIPFSLPVNKSSHILAIFEAAIDAASHASVSEMMGQEPFHIHRVATGGTPHMEGIFQYLNSHPEIDEIWLGQDMDEAGEKQREAIISAVQNTTEYSHIKIKNIQPLSGCKDWNESLQVWRSTIKQSVSSQLKNRRKAAAYRIHLLTADRSIAQSLDFASQSKLEEFLKKAQLNHNFVVETPTSYHVALNELSWENQNHRNNSQTRRQGVSPEPDLAP